MIGRTGTKKRPHVGPFPFVGWVVLYMRRLRWTGSSVSLRPTT